MVSLRGTDRRGASSMGCLVTLLLFAAALYYGVHIGEVYWRYYQLVDEMRSQARLAPSLNDQVIRRRLVARAAELEIPSEGQRFKISRSSRPRQITIQTEYRESVDLPFFSHTFVLQPRAQEPL